MSETRKIARRVMLSGLLLAGLAAGCAPQSAAMTLPTALAIVAQGTAGVTPTPMAPPTSTRSPTHTAGPASTAIHADAPVPPTYTARPTYTANPTYTQPAASIAPPAETPRPVRTATPTPSAAPSRVPTLARIVMPTPVPVPTMPPVQAPAPTRVATPTSAVLAPAQGTNPAPDCPNPNARITSPGIGERIHGIVPFRGSANIPNFKYLKVEYRTAGAPNWNYLTRADSPVADGTLFEWYTSTVPAGEYEVRLIVVDNTGNYPEPCLARVTTF